jgi:hypothetical protein
MGDAVSVTVIATGFTGSSTRQVHDNPRMQATQHEGQGPALSFTSSHLHQQSTQMQVLASQIQSFENINLSAETPQSLAPLPVDNSPAAPRGSGPVFHTQPVHQSSGKDKSLPREILLAKARAYRESQSKDSVQPEQLTMHMEEPQRQSVEARSPFESDNLDVPAYLRRKRDSGANETLE